MMDKRSLEHWIKTVVSPSTPSRRLIVVDSWSAFTVHDNILDHLPLTCDAKVINIPKNTTRWAQPLDVHWNGPFKKMVSDRFWLMSCLVMLLQMRKFVDYALAHEPTYIIGTRNNLLTIVSLIYKQFCAPVFRSFNLYSWAAAGYIDTYPPFVTPKVRCFPPNLAANICYLCPATSFILCANCDHYFCWEHFVLDYHYC